MVGNTEERQWQGTGDYSLQTLVIETPNDKIDVSLLLRNFEWTEDLTFSFMYGSLQLVDSLNLISNLPLIGGEKVEAKLKMLHEDYSVQECTLRFRIFKIANWHLENERTSVYTLHLISEEAFLDRRRRISLRFKAKTLHEAVSSIVSNRYESDKEVVSGEEIGMPVDFLCPNWRPSRAIEWLCSRTIGFEDSVDWRFFERHSNAERSLQEFVVISYEELLRKARDDADKKKIWFQPANIRDEAENKQFEKDAYAAQSWAFLEVENVLDSLEFGLYASNLVVHDLTRKEIRTKTFDYEKSWSEEDHIEPNVLAKPESQSKTMIAYEGSEFFDLPEQSMLRFIPENQSIWNEGKTKDQLERILLRRASRIYSRNNLVLRVDLYGNPDYILGEGVDFEMPSPEMQPYSENHIDERFSGSWLITRISHSINIDRYVTSLRLVKDALAKPLPNASQIERLRMEGYQQGT